MGAIVFNSYDTKKKHIRSNILKRIGKELAKQSKTKKNVICWDSLMQQTKIIMLLCVSYDSWLLYSSKRWT